MKAIQLIRLFLADEDSALTALGVGFFVFVAGLAIGYRLIVEYRIDKTLPSSKAIAIGVSIFVAGCAAMYAGFHDLNYYFHQLQSENPTLTVGGLIGKMDLTTAPGIALTIVMIAVALGLLLYIAVLNRVVFLLVTGKHPFMPKSRNDKLPK